MCDLGIKVAYIAIHNHCWMIMIFHWQSSFALLGGRIEIMSSARLELPYPCTCVFPRPSRGSRFLRGESYMTM